MVGSCAMVRTRSALLDDEAPEARWPIRRYERGRVRFAISMG